MLSYSFLVAQPEEGLGPSSYSKHFSISGNNILLTINAGIQTPTWLYCDTLSCNEFKPLDTTKIITSKNGVGEIIISNLTSNTGIVEVIKNQNTIEGEYNFTLIARNNQGSVKQREFKIIVRAPMHLVFVLDRSGSMECPDEEATNWPCNNSPNDSRWNKLKSAIVYFLEKFGEDTILNEDRFNVVYFSGAIASSTDTDPSKSINGFISVQDFKAKIVDNMESAPRELMPFRLGRDGTSIGEGLFHAIKNTFGNAEDANTTQRILLFSDGEDNRSSLETNGGNRIVKSSNNDSKDLSDPNIDELEIFTIGAASNASIVPAASQLDEIASPDDNPNSTSRKIWASQHTFYDATGTTGFLTTICDNLYMQLLEGYSPNYILFKDMKLKGQNKIKFALNKKVHRLMFDAHFEKPYATRFEDLKITRNGEDVTEWASINYGSYYIKVDFNFNDITTFDSEGEWIFTCNSEGFIDKHFNRSGSSNLRLSATADDTAIKLRFSAGNKKLRVGDKITPTVSLKHYGNSVQDAKVKVTIYKPGDDLGDILAREPNNIEPNQEQGGYATSKYTYLQLNKPEVLKNYLNKKVKTIDLEYTPTGIYKGIYDGLDVAGVYRLVYTVEVDIPGLGKVKRMKEQTINVRVGIVDLDLNIKERQVTKDGSTIIWTIRPQYMSSKGKKYIGPGYSYAIGIDKADVNSQTVTDLGDGRYKISFTPKSNNANINLYFFGDEIYTGKVKDFIPRYKRGLSFHGGITKPYNTMDSLYNDGIYGEIDLSYKLSNNLILEGVGGYYSFEPDFNIFGATLFLKGYFPFVKNGVSFSLAGGGGTYWPKGEDMTTGVAARVALHIPFNPKFKLVADAGYFSLHQSRFEFSNPKYEFLTLGGGLKFAF